MREQHKLPIEKIYVPAKRARTRDEGKVQEIAESVLEEGLKIPISVRKDGDRYVLVEGLQRLEAFKALGEDTILGYFVQARIR